MTKTEAMELLGCETVTRFADTLGITKGAVSQWPEELPAHAVRRVESVLYKKVARRVKHR